MRRRGFESAFSCRGGQNYYPTQKGVFGTQWRFLARESAHNPPTQTPGNSQRNSTMLGYRLVPLLALPGIMAQPIMGFLTNSGAWGCAFIR